MYKHLVHSILFLIISILSFIYFRFSSIIFFSGFLLATSFYNILRLRLDYKYSNSVDYIIVRKELIGLTIICGLGIIINLIYIILWFTIL